MLANGRHSMKPTLLRNLHEIGCLRTREYPLPFKEVMIFLGLDDSYDAFNLSLVSNCLLHELKASHFLKKSLKNTCLFVKVIANRFL